MAHINISVCDSDDLYTIELDPWWSSLTVDGEEVPPTSTGFTFTQTNPGPLVFVAQASKTQIKVANPSSYLVLKGSGKVDHTCSLNWSTSGHSTILGGRLMNQPRAMSGPILFSQDLLTGVFELAE